MKKDTSMTILIVYLFVMFVISIILAINMLYNMIMLSKTVNKLSQNVMEAQRTLSSVYQNLQDFELIE